MSGEVDNSYSGVAETSRGTYHVYDDGHKVAHRRTWRGAKKVERGR